MYGKELFFLIISRSCHNFVFSTVPLSTSVKDQWGAVYDNFSCFQRLWYQKVGRNEFQDKSPHPSVKSQTGVQVPCRITCLQPLQFKSLPFYDNFVHWHNMSQHCGSACSSLWPLSKHQGAWPGNPGQGSTASDPVKILIKIIIWSTPIMCPSPIILAASSRTQAIAAAFDFCQHWGPMAQATLIL